MQVDFYILKAEKPQARYPLVCQLLEKAYSQQHACYVHTEDEKEAHVIDDLLWTFKDNSFIPHNMIGEGPNPPPPIQIGFTDNMPNKKNILVNLAGEIPSSHQQFQHIIEIVPQDETYKQQLRTHYRFYQQQGYTIQTHEA